MEGTSLATDQAFDFSRVRELSNRSPNFGPIFWQLSHPLHFEEGLNI
jgi:hypothetical protein